MKIRINYLYHCLVVSFLFFGLIEGFSLESASAQEKGGQYAAKFLCGKSQGIGAVQGIYETAVNVHNPTYEHIPVRYKVAVGLPGGEEGPISPFKNMRLGPDGAAEFVCKDVFGMLDSLGGLPSLVTGFFVLESPSDLDVVSVVSSSDPSGTSVALEIFEVRAKTVKHVLPDLIVDSLCVWTRDKATATIKNVGAAPATSSTTRIFMTPVLDDFITPSGPTVIVDLPTLELAVGGVTFVEAEIPASCYGPNCQVRAETDVLDAVLESEEMNNESGVSVCIG